MKPKSMYDAGFKAGRESMFKDSLELILKCVSLSLWHHDFPKEDILLMKDDITDAVMYYGENPEQMKRIMAVMEEDLGCKIIFKGREEK